MIAIEIVWLMLFDNVQSTPSPLVSPALQQFPIKKSFFQFYYITILSYTEHSKKNKNIKQKQYVSIYLSNKLACLLHNIYIYIYIYYKSVGCQLITLWICVEPSTI